MPIEEKQVSVLKYNPKKETTELIDVFESDIPKSYNQIDPPRWRERPARANN